MNVLNICSDDELMSEGDDMCEGERMSHLLPSPRVSQRRVRAQGRRARACGAAAHQIAGLQGPSTSHTCRALYLDIAKVTFFFFFSIFSFPGQDVR